MNERRVAFAVTSVGGAGLSDVFDVIAMMRPCFALLSKLRAGRCLSYVGREGICEDLKVQPSVFYEWQKNIFERAAASFGSS